MNEQKIVVLATGGTIAGTAAVAGESFGYTAAQLGVQQLLASVPGLAARKGGAALVAEQVAQIDSKDMELAVWVALAQACERHLSDPQVRGIVITHGTDTLEETAWFLQQVLRVTKPVVLTCAIRPATALAPDGPANLLDAVALAASTDLAAVVLVAAGEVHGAAEVRKQHPHRVHAFSSGEAGPWGWMELGKVRWASFMPGVGVNTPCIAIENIAKIVTHQTVPWVEIVLSHAGAQARGVDALVAAGVQGLVVACTGNGTVHHALEQPLLRAQAQGVRVVRTTRCAEGHILEVPADGEAVTLPLAAGLSPVKARVSLLLELMAHSHSHSHG